MKRSVASGLVLALLAALPAACGSSTPKARERVRGETVTVLAHDSFLVSKSVFAQFTRTTGIKVKVLQHGDGGAVVSQAILTRDHPQADVVFGVDNTFLSRALDHDLFEARSYRGLDVIERSVRDRFKASESRAVPIDFGDVCLNYDIDWFAQHSQKPPTSLGDIALPRYRGLTVVESPATSSTGLAFLLATVARYGASGYQRFWKALQGNDVLAVDGWEQAYDTEFSAGAGHGTRPIVVSYASSPPADVVYSEPKKSAPSIGVVLDGCFRQYEFAGVLRHAAHKQAAQQLVEFMLSKVFQEDMPLNMFVFPVRTGATLPKVFSDFARIPAHPLTLDPKLIEAHRDEWIATWTDVVLP